MGCMHAHGLQRQGQPAHCTNSTCALFATQPNANNTTQCAQGCISYCVALIRGRVGVARARLGLDVRCTVSRCHVRWLGLTAARRVLGR